MREINGKSQNPGAGGWPTLRYFNAKTGYEGAACPKKTEEAMCDEFGKPANMQACVEEMSGASLCDIAKPDGCTEKQVAYIEKWKTKGADAAKKEMARLEKIVAAGGMKPEAEESARMRIGICKQLAKAAKEEL